MYAWGKKQTKKTDLEIVLIIRETSQTATKTFSFSISKHHLLNLQATAESHYSFLI